MRVALGRAAGAVLPGVTRGAVMEMAGEMGIPVHPAAITIEQLLDADEVFITNSIMGIMPVCRVERRAIADDKPGPITTRLSNEFEQLIISELGG